MSLLRLLPQRSLLVPNERIKSIADNFNNDDMVVTYALGFPNQAKQPLGLKVRYSNLDA